MIPKNTTFILVGLLTFSLLCSQEGYAKSKVSSKKTCQSIEIGGWAFNGNEQKEEVEKITKEMKDCDVFVSAEILYIDYRDSGAVFSLKEGASFAVDGVKIGSTLGIQHTQDWIQVSAGPCHVEKVPREIKPKGMKTPIAQVLKCSGPVTGWGREMKKLSIVTLHDI